MQLLWRKDNLKIQTAHVSNFFDNFLIAGGGPKERFPVVFEPPAQDLWG